MATKYFSTSSGSSKQLPFFSDWYSGLTEQEKEFLEGWKFVVYNFRYQEKSGKGYFLDTLKFTTFLFKSHPFVKELGDNNFIENYRGIVFCVEVDSSEQWGYKFCLEDEVICDWEDSLTEGLGVVTKGTYDLERKLIFQGFPPIVPSLPPNLNGKGKGKGKATATATPTKRGQEGTLEG